MQNKAYRKNEHARFLGIDCSSDCVTKSCLILSINATKCCLISIQNKFNINLRKSRPKFSKPKRHNSRSHQVLFSRPRIIFHPFSTRDHFLPHQKSRFTNLFVASHSPATLHSFYHPPIYSSPPSKLIV